MLGKRLINTGGVACTTDTVQILNAESTYSKALYRFEDNANDTASGSGKFGKGAIFSGSSSDTISTASSPLNFGTSDYSVSLWVNTRTLAANQALICPYDGNGLLVNIVQPNGYIDFITMEEHLLIFLQVQLLQILGTMFVLLWIIVPQLKYI